MLEFTLNRRGRGKESRLIKKYPRKRILRKGSEKSACCDIYGKYNNTPYFNGNLHRFLVANVGRPVDKVFSEFLKRCKKGTKRYNLREEFYNMFEEKENISYHGGFYLSNGIINYKKRRRRTQQNYTHYYTPSVFDYEQFNIQNLPNKKALLVLCNEADKTHKKQLLGSFYILDDYCSKAERATVYIVAGLDYKTSYFNMDITEIKGIGIGMNFSIWSSSDSFYYTSNYTYRKTKKLPQYVFVVKRKRTLDK